MINWEALKPSDVIALLAVLLSGWSLLYSMHLGRAAKRQIALAQQREDLHFHQVEARERELFRKAEERERQVHVAANYLALETSSSEIFKYTADNETKIACLRGRLPGPVWSDPDYAEAGGILTNLYYQSLNLFEVSARFRRDDLIKPQVFASWVAWMIEILEDDFFRAHWPSLIRSNYTRDVRDIFDVGVQIFSSDIPEESRNQAFYAAVGEIMDDCSEISGWLEDITKETEWSALKCSRLYPSNGAVHAA